MNCRQRSGERLATAATTPLPEWAMARQFLRAM
jgi:hypothetical protein